MRRNEARLTLFINAETYNGTSLSEYGDNNDDFCCFVTTVE